MKKATIIFLVILAMAGTCGAEIPPDSNYVWHVAKDGNNADDGHSYANAKLTIAAAITAAGTNNKIVIWPGSYNEYITLADGLDIEGIGYVYIYWDTNSYDTITLGNKNVLTNLNVYQTSTTNSATAPANAIKGSIKTEARMIDCTFDSAQGYGGNFTRVTYIDIENCRFIGGMAGLYSGGASAGKTILGRARGSYFLCDGGGVPPTSQPPPYFYTGFYSDGGCWSINDCVIRGNYGASDATHTACGIRHEIAGNGTCQVSNSIILTTTTTNDYEQAASAADTSGKGFYNYSNCYIKSFGTGANSYDLYQVGDCILSVNGCYYNTAKTYGTIIDKTQSTYAKLPTIDSTAADVNTLLDYTDPNNFSKAEEFWTIGDANSQIAQDANKAAERANTLITDVNGLQIDLNTIFTQLAAIVADTNDIQEDWAALLADINDIETDTNDLQTARGVPVIR